MKFRFSDGLPFVSIACRIGNRRANFDAIIDTGSAGSALDVNVLPPDFAKDGRFAEIVGVGGSQPVMIQAVDEIKIGSTQIDSFELEFTDLENNFGVQAIIGSDLLRQQRAIINYKDSSLTLL